MGRRSASRAPAARPFPRPDDRAYLLVPAGARGPAFLMLQNFRVIMKYNPAEAYALAIGHLADRLRGGGPLLQAWPREERALTLAERYEMQQLLASAASTSASPTAASARAPASPSATSRSRPGKFPTASLRATCSTVCASRDRAILPHLRRTVR